MSNLVIIVKGSERTALEANGKLIELKLRFLCSSMHQSIPAAPSAPPSPPAPRADPRALAFFLPWMANSWGWGLLSCQIPRSGDEKRGQMPRPP